MIATIFKKHTMFSNLNIIRLPGQVANTTTI